MKYLILAVAVLCIDYGQAYNALVVEHYPVQKGTPEETIKENLNSYRLQVEKERVENVNIVVFPEYGLTTRYVDPEDYAIEINDETDSFDLIRDLRAISAEHQVYLVVNLLEKVREPNKKTKYYNTNLVFDKGGNITAKYRKINLYQEPKLTPGTNVTTFYADGVRFGVMTSFDILFYNPSRSILEDETVTDIVYPTSWISAVPFFTSLSIQHGYAVANGVNLLAAGYGRPKEGFGGSGIYLADGKIAETYIDVTPSGKPLFQKVTELDRRQKPTSCSSIARYGLPIEGGTPDISTFKTEKVFDSSDYKFQDIDLSNEKVSTTFCHGDFCCNFNITIRQPANTSEHYKLVVYDGQVNYNGTKFYGRICGLVACESDSKSSCGARINGTTSFTKIHVDARLNENNTTFYAPVTLKYNLKPIEETTYCDSSDNDKSHVELSTLASQKGVLAFGILGRTNAASSIASSGFFFLLVLVVAKFIM